MKKTAVCFSFSVLVLALTGTLAPEANAAATCFCKISKDVLTNLTASSGVCRDLTATVGHSYTGLNQQGEANRQNCNDPRCKNAATPLIGNQAVATACCQLGAANGTPIYAYSAVGTKTYRSGVHIGNLTNTPAVTQTKCPVGWLANPTNVDGGVTSDGKCKKLSAQPLLVPPLPPNGTPIGTYGFTWGNAVYAWGTTANGGAAITTTITAAVCHF